MTRAAPLLLPGAPIRHGFRADDLPAATAWRTSELRTLRAHYPQGGARAVAGLLPHRTVRAIRECARRLADRHDRGRLRR